MTDEVVLSVCLTAYNEEKYIERAIESVLRQKTDFAYEIIVADDCSTDKTIDILQAYQQRLGERFKILYAEKNRGLTVNFFEELEHVSGKFIAVLDADDEWTDENKLQAQVNLLQQHSNIGFVYTNFYYYREEDGSQTPGFINRVHNAATQYEDYLLNVYIVPSTLCFRYSLVNFDLLRLFIQKKFITQDYSLFMDFNLKAQGYYLDKITTQYTIRQNSLSKLSDMKKRIDYFHKCYDIGTYFIEQYPVTPEVAATRDFNFRLKMLLTAWEIKDFSLVKQYARQLQLTDFLKHNPKAGYIYIASKSKLLYHLFIPWVLRKRKAGS
ncbi:hypothetical protein A9P82_07055 [Arachidicoccus ginsenosidimutans]|uniref:glycosyltransferase family 2 protein n=1 Tax=Arachidicoccus sp. BS20 TaxID=1850526 RepID=UPI0007F0BC0C|nr:glycosyltransferase family 2 protein [Arachidicoccus sp. BS20]ANI89067.1 hypothetical protein A9P82_07055 [Arachidicoccus sp. BS20]